MSSTRQSVNKELQALQRESLIELNGRRVTLLDVEGLRSLVGLWSHLAKPKVGP